MINPRPAEETTNFISLTNPLKLRSKIRLRKIKCIATYNCQAANQRNKT